MVDTALSRILKDILAIPDITAEESQKLSELCRIMNSLEALFVEDPDHVRFFPLCVVSTADTILICSLRSSSTLCPAGSNSLICPSCWSVLSAPFMPLQNLTDLVLSTQEASIADISYLFEEGALVDFKIEELVNLVRALFADTPLRANTINRLMQGHPVVTSS